MNIQTKHQRLPSELISQILNKASEEKELLSYRLINREQSVLINKTIWQEPDHKLLKLNKIQFEPLVIKYGHLINQLIITDTIGMNNLNLIFKYCKSIRSILFYGNSKLLTAVKDKLPLEWHLNQIEIYLLDELSSLDDLLFIQSYNNYLTNLTIHYNDVDIVNNLLSKLTNINELTIYQLDVINKELITTINQQFKQLNTLCLQSIKIRDDAINHFNIEFQLSLKRFELDINIYTKGQVVLLINTNNLKCININLNQYKINQQILGFNTELKGLISLTLSNLTTSSPNLFHQFENLREIILDSYRPLDSNILMYLIFEMNSLLYLQINKGIIKDEDFNLPIVFNKMSPLKNFIISKNQQALSICYLRFIFHYLPKLSEWIVPNISPNNGLDGFIMNMVNWDMDYINNIHIIYTDLTTSTIPLFHFIIQSFTNLKECYLNLMDNELDISQLITEFKSINKDDRVTIKFN